MRFLCYAAAILILASGFAPAQSTAPPDASQATAKPAALEARIEALERKLDQLEKRVDAALPAQSQAPIQPNPATSNPAPADRMAALEQKVQLLESAQTNHLAATTAPQVSLDSKGFSISSPDGSWRFRVGGYAQADSKTFVDDPATINGVTNLIKQSNNFNLRRARLVVSGSYSRLLDFYVAPEFSGYGSSLLGSSVNGLSNAAPAFSTSLYDAYGDVRFAPFLILRGGKFKSPFGLEQLQSITDVTFLTRSLATDLVPNRDVGFMLWGNVLNRFSYQAALLNGALDLNGSKGDGSAHDSHTFMARLFAMPFAKNGPEALTGLGIGVAVSTGHQDAVYSKGAVIGTGLPTFKTIGGEVPFFQYIGGPQTTVTSSCNLSCVVSTAMQANSAVARGNEVRFSPQAYYYYGPFGLVGEYVQDGEHIAGSTGNSFSLGSAGTREIDNRAWQVTGSWVITGEKKGYVARQERMRQTLTSWGGVVPKRSMDHVGSPFGYGAWEVAARYSALTIDPTAFMRVGNSYFAADPTKSPQAAREWGIALNWYLNTNLRMGLNYELTKFKGYGNTFVLPTEKVFSERMQLVF